MDSIDAGVEKLKTYGSRNHMLYHGSKKKTKEYDELRDKVIGYKQMESISDRFDKFGNQFDDQIDSGKGP